MSKIKIMKPKYDCIKDDESCINCEFSEKIDIERIYCSQHNDIFPITSKIWCALFKRSKR
jgi:hypothetical protein